MKTASINHSFEINIKNVVNPTATIAVGQSINTLTSGEILKVKDCNKKTFKALKNFCKQSGNKLLQKTKVNNEVTLFIKKS